MKKKSYNTLFPNFKQKRPLSLSLPLYLSLSLPPSLSLSLELLLVKYFQTGVEEGGKGTTMTYFKSFPTKARRAYTHTHTYKHAHAHSGERRTKGEKGREGGGRV